MRIRTLYALIVVALTTGVGTGTTRAVLAQEPVGPDPIVVEIAEDRVAAFARALGKKRVTEVFRYLDPVHIVSNIRFYDTFDIDDRETVDFAICNWGLMPYNGAPFLSSIAQIKTVKEYRLETSQPTWQAFFSVTLVDGRAAVYTTFVDPATLYFYGAAG